MRCQLTGHAVPETKTTDRTAICRRLEILRCRHLQSELCSARPRAGLEFLVTNLKAAASGFQRLEVLVTNSEAVTSRFQPEMPPNIQSPKACCQTFWASKLMLLWKAVPLQFGGRRGTTCNFTLATTGLPKIQGENNILEKCRYSSRKNPRGSFLTVMTYIIAKERELNLESYDLGHVWPVRGALFGPSLFFQVGRIKNTIKQRFQHIC